jgi:hypothetical protein
MLGKRPEKKVNAAKLVLRALLDMKAKCFGNKSRDSVARSETWGIETSRECNYIMF